jgi:hypothetical protein
VKLVGVAVAIFLIFQGSGIRAAINTGFHPDHVRTPAQQGIDPVLIAIFNELGVRAA